MVVRGTDKQDRSKKIGCDSAMRSEETESSLEINVPKSTESEWWFQECIEATPGSRGEISTDYYLALAWMYDTQDIRCPPQR